jgi:hypothetical protein
MMRETSQSVDERKENGIPDSLGWSLFLSQDVVSERGKKKLKTEQGK